MWGKKNSTVHHYYIILPDIWRHFSWYLHKKCKSSRIWGCHTPQTPNNYTITCAEGLEKVGLEENS